MSVAETLVAIGRRLGFEVATEVEASRSAWVDVVWFDPKVSLLQFGVRKPRLRSSPVLPVIGFEIERRTALDAKHVKGSVANLETLGAQVGVIILGRQNIAAARARAQRLARLSDGEVQRHLLKQLSAWVYAEAQPRIRVAIMTEEQIDDWARALGIPTAVDQLSLFRTAATADARALLQPASQSPDPSAMRPAHMPHQQAPGWPEPAGVVTPPE